MKTASVTFEKRYTMSTASSTEATAANKTKHTSSNPLMRWSISRFHETVRDLLPAAQMVLEVGCGEGFSAQAALGGRPGMRSFGGDLFLDVVREARIRFPSMRYCVLDATRLPFADSCVDVVFSLEVLEHLPDPGAAVRELMRVSRRYVLLSVPNEPIFRIQRFMSGKGILLLGDHPEHVNHWSLWGFRQFVEAQGLTVLQAVSPLPFAWSVLLCERQADR